MPKKNVTVDLSKLDGKKLRRTQNSLLEQLEGRQLGLVIEEDAIIAKKVTWKHKKEKK